MFRMHRADAGEACGSSGSENETMEAIALDASQYDEGEDECESVGSSTGSSQVAGRWWFGRSTRYVPHCQKHGHKHGNGDCDEQNGGNYLTPTQRRTRELAQLKKELR